MADDEDDGDEGEKGFDIVSFAEELTKRRRLRKGKHADFTALGAIRPQNPPWLWPNYLSRRIITMLAGNSAMGKSQISISLAATLTKTHTWPNGTAAPDGSVLMLTAEDDPEFSLRPRLDAVGGDPARVHVLRSIQIDGKPQIFSIQANLDLIAAKVRELGDVALVIIDPISAFMGTEVDAHRQTEVRGAMMPLHSFVHELNIAALVIAHPSKNPGGESLNYIAGSGAFVHAPRITFVAVPDATNAERKLFLPSKNNCGPLAKGIGFSIMSTFVGENSEVLTSYIAWDDKPVDVTANEALAQNAEKLKSSASKKAAEFLDTALKDGKRPAREIMDEAERNGISERTLKRTRKDKGIRSWKDKFHGKLWWSTEDEQEP